MPAPQRYVTWLLDFLRGDWGRSLALQVPVSDLVLSRIANSLVLAGLALVITVPLSIGFGLLAALRQGRLTDRAISLIGICGLAIPEFVSGVLLILLFSLTLHVAPASAQIPARRQSALGAAGADSARPDAGTDAIRVYLAPYARVGGRGARQRLRAHRRAEGSADAVRSSVATSSATRCCRR